MESSCHRHDISDAVWSLLEPHLPGQRGQWGGIAQNNRCLINAVFWVLRTGTPWRDLPPDYGKWENGAERKQKLTAAGYDYATVQNRVNAIFK